MSPAFGLAPDSEGNGTSPADLQKVLWSMFSIPNGPGIVRGLGVSGRSDLRYAVEGGVAAFPNGSQRALLVPYAASTPVTTAPATGTRTDYIYATSDGAVLLGTTQPAGTALIGKRRVPANITATTATTDLLGDRRFAPLFGGTMGRIAAWHSNLADLAPITDAVGVRRQCCALTFTLESDRRLSFTLQQSYDLNRGANNGDDPEGWKVASFVWEYWIDGVHRLSLEMGVEAFAETKQNSYEFDTLAGTHTVEVYRTRRLVGKTNDVVVHRIGGSANWPGTSFKINDMGGIS